MECLSENDLLAWADGRLPDERVHDLDSHVDSCDHCQSLLAEALRDSFDGHELPRPGPASKGTTFRGGELLAGRYRVVRFVARGGMGEVYEVEDQWLQQTVALKTLLASIADDASALARLKAEVLLARRIAHPNVCRVFDLGFAEKPSAREGSARERIAFLTMEFLRGETLKAHLRRVGPLSVATALPLAEQLLAGLAHAHAVGIIHRDFKSDNVMLVADPETGELTAEVTDFGLARSLLFGVESITSSGNHALGTLDYMAPEQVQGRPATRQGDIYSFGIVAFEMLTGRLPFDAESPVARAFRRAQAPAPRVSDLVDGVPPNWERVIARCLEREPNARFADISEILPLLAKPAPRAKVVWRGLLGLALGSLGVGAVALLGVPARPQPIGETPRLASASSPRAHTANSAVEPAAPAPFVALANSSIGGHALVVGRTTETAAHAAIGGAAQAKMPATQPSVQARSAKPSARGARAAPASPVDATGVRPSPNRLLDPFADP